MIARSTGTYLAAAGCFGLTLMILFTASVRYSEADRFTDPVHWIFAIIGAGLAGFWAYVPLLMAGTMPSDFGRKLCIGLGLLYLVIAALATHEFMTARGLFERMFEFLFLPAISSVIMAPLVLLVRHYGRKV